MIFREYEDFNEAYIQLNREILLNPHKMVHHEISTMADIDGLYLEIKSPKCDQIDLGAMGYAPQKFSHLVRTYLGEEKIRELTKLGVGIRGLAYGFDFKRKTVNNGACMRELIISRKDRNKPWDTITVIWRTTELNRRWATDLILVARIMELIPNSKFERIRLFMPKAYQSSIYTVPLLEPIFDVTIEQLDETHKHTGLLRKNWVKYYDPVSPPTSLMSMGMILINLHTI